MSDVERTKLSGHQYKKRRLENETQRQKQAGALKTYLQNTSSSTKTKDGSEKPTSNLVIEEKTESSKSDDDKKIDNISKSTRTGSNPLPNENTLKIGINPTPTENELQTLSTDPALWPRILGDADRSFLMRQGPPEPLYNYKFPSDDTGRKFSANYYNSLAKEGFKSWKHLVETLKDHEISKNHIQTQKSWLELSQRLKGCKTIDAAAQRIINAETNHWYEVLLRIVAITKMLGKKCLAFQGTSDKLFEHNNGNFLKIVELLSEFDPIMEEHVRRVLKKEETKAHYLGKNIQNEIIDLLHQSVKSDIINQIKKAKYYSIILDYTPDVSKVEQMTLVIRYVSINKSDSNEVEIKISESFLGFLPVERSTGKQMSEIIIRELNDLGLNLQDMRGQGYDNGANMRGGKAGVQSRIQNVNSRAFYVPCRLTLKPLSDTRWESRIEALKPLRFYMGDVYDALLSIYENQDIDNLIRDEASGLLNCIKQFKFLCSIVIWYKIINCINPISKLLQTKGFDLASALDLLQNCKKFFEDLRSDKSFNETIVDARELADEINVEANFESTVPRHRVRRKKTNFSYEARDETIKDPKEQYKTEFFYFTIDRALNALDARFEQLSHHSNYLQFLYDIYDSKTMSKETLLTHCKDLESILTDGDSVDINGVELTEEISAVSALLGKKESPNDVLKLLTTLNFAPNLNVALRILLTLPITVASGERSFSKLKLIKNFLRSTTTQNRLNSLAILAIEHEIADQINLREIIKKFAELKSTDPNPTEGSAPKKKDHNKIGGSVGIDWRSKDW
ncbi:zinc finger MYM-type protein 1-like [Athalia rosae]|uniref:zinc finger MYM-type protein 1-like n=1 Tax=Athalia rosae TaxID=37344 RepID=UPI0020339896|nr:zinc finger MYM-type protein 1-like [Athalia rosae]